MQGNNSNDPAYLFNAKSFQTFFEEWAVAQREYMNRLLFLSSQNREDNELESLVGHVLSHYQHYYKTKSRLAKENVFTLFSPPWFSTLERSLLWITGFKPALAFRIMERSVGSELTEQQVEKIQRLKVTTVAMEKGFGNEMSNVQESMAEPMWVRMVSTTEKQAVDGELDQGIERITEQLRDLVINADFLRETTSRELVDILSPVQAARFLAATALRQLKVRNWGLQRDADMMYV